MFWNLILIVMMVTHRRDCRENTLNCVLEKGEYGMWRYLNKNNQTKNRTITKRRTQNPPYQVSEQNTILCIWVVRERPWAERILGLGLSLSSSINIGMALGKPFLLLVPQFPHLLSGIAVRIYSWWDFEKYKVLSLTYKALIKSEVSL